MIKIELEQGSPEWIAFRKNHLGGSDAPAVMGVSNWDTPYSIWMDKLGLSKPKFINSFMQRGIRLEPFARAKFIELTGIKVAPAVFVSDKTPFMMASVDGISECGKYVVEIKCGEKDHEIAITGKIPDHYIPQLQHTMYVCKLKEIFYFSYNENNSIILKLSRDDEYIERLIEESSRLWQYVLNLDPPPTKNNDYVDMSNDEKAILTSRDYFATCHEIERLDNRKKFLKEELIKIANGQNVKVFNMEMCQVVRKGNINYSLIPELKSVNLDDYRSDKITSWRITKSKEYDSSPV